MDKNSKIPRIKLIKISKLQISFHRKKLPPRPHPIIPILQESPYFPRFCRPLYASVSHRRRPHWKAAGIHSYHIFARVFASSKRGTTKTASI